MEQKQDLPLYKCHKTVQASRILQVRRDAWELVLEAPIVYVVGPEWLAKHKPEPGGYFVRYADGYESYSPPEAFEGGYTKLEQLPRRLHDHETNDANRQITLTADPQNPQNGNASHVYAMAWTGRPDGEQRISFQDGPINEVGVNGVTNEALLAIVIDRMRGFQSSRYACRENAIALTKLEEALHWLHARTRARELRGVEGTHKV